MKISMIAAMSKNRVIGKDNDLPWHLPNDLQFFKKSTMGKPVIMGRRTFESIGRALPNRLNIVITRNPEWEYEDVACVSDLNAAIGLAAQSVLLDRADEIMVIGGATIYAQALPLAHRIYLTRVDADIQGDTFFPEFDEAQWIIASEECHKACDKNPYDYRFQILDRK